MHAATIHPAYAPAHRMLDRIMDDRANSGMHPMNTRTKTAIIDALVGMDGGDIVHVPECADDSYANNIRPQQLDDARFQRITHLVQHMPQLARAWALGRTQPIRFSFTSFAPNSAHYVVGIDA